MSTQPKFLKIWIYRRLAFSRQAFSRFSSSRQAYTNSILIKITSKICRYVKSIYHFPFIYLALDLPDPQVCMQSQAVDYIKCHSLHDPDELVADTFVLLDEASFWPVPTKLREQICKSKDISCNKNGITIYFNAFKGY